jgi:manganese efflux pump family protein
MIAALLFAVALAMDATAVAMGRAVLGMQRRAAVVLASSFGVSHAGMAGIGWALGEVAKPFIERWDHWVAFGLLAAIGVKMVYEAWRRPAEGAGASRSDPELRAILLLSLATSIDTLAAGITLPLLPVSPSVAIALIGITAFGLSLLGALAGVALGSRFGRRLEVAGGLTLIGIGLKTVIDHVR